MGKAIIIPDVDFSNKGMGAVTPLQNVPLEGLNILGQENIIEYYKFSVEYIPTFTLERAVRWSVISGSDYAEINESTGEIFAKQGAKNSSVTIRVVSLLREHIYAEKNIVVSAAGTLWDKAASDIDFARFMVGKSKLYENDSEIVRTGSELGIGVPQPITSLSQNFVVLFDVSFASVGGINRCVFSRLADNAAFATLNDVNTWLVDMKWNPTNVVGALNGTRTEMLIAFNKSTSSIFLKNLTTGETKTFTNVTGGGTLRDAFYVGGGATSTNNFVGTIHKFYVGG